jgi:hypothetical protein
MNCDGFFCLRELPNHVSLAGLKFGICRNGISFEDRAVPERCGQDCYYETTLLQEGLKQAKLEETLIMRAKRILRSTLFGQIVPLLGLLGLNIYHALVQFWQSCFDCDTGFGLPFRIYASGDLARPSRFLRIGFLTDILISVALGLLITLMIRTIISRRYE